MDRNTYNPIRRKEPGEISGMGEGGLQGHLGPEELSDGLII